MTMLDTTQPQDPIVVKVVFHLDTYAKLKKLAAIFASTPGDTLFAAINAMYDNAVADGRIAP